MSKGSNSTVTDSRSTVSPSAPAYQAYQDLLTRAQGVSNTPYQAYGGEEIAGINSTQQGGIGNISGMADAFQPYGEQAGANIAGGASAVNADDIAQYYDPYQQQVIDATQHDFDTQNQRANSITTGNAASQGALGGNRVGVAQALTQEGQSRVQAPVIAGLRSSGFQSAVANANAQKTRQLQGGQAELQGGEQAAAAQVGAGTLEQQTQQAKDTQSRSDYFQAQGYPFATAQWLASITLPTGAQMGSVSTGNSATQGPQPNQWMQAAGVGLSAAAMFSDRRLKENIKEIGNLHDGQKIYRYNFKGDNKTQVGLIADEVEKKHPEAVGEHGGFGTVDYDAATADAVRHFGGRIAGFAGGGAPGMDVSGGNGWVPSFQMQATPLQPSKFPEHAKLPEQKDQTAGIGKSLGTIGKSLYDKYGQTQGDNGLATDAADNGSGIYTGDAATPGFGGSPDLGGSSGFGSWFARGGGVRRGFADGGVPVSAGFGGSAIDDDLSPNDAIDERFANPLLGSDQYRNLGEHTAALKAEGVRRLPAAGVAQDEPLTARPVQTTSFTRPPDEAPEQTAQGDIVPKAKQAFSSIMGGQQPKRALGFAPEDEGAPDDAPTDVSARKRATPAGVPPGVAAAPTTGMGGWNPLGISDEARQGLISMGLGMMSNRTGGKGSFLAGVGEAGAQGMSTYASAKAATAAQAKQAREEAFAREKFDRPYKEMTAHQKAEAGLKPWRIGEGGNLEATPGGPHDPKTIRAEAEAKLPPSLMTPQSLDTAADTFRMTGKLPPNMGRGTQGAMEATMIRNRAAEREQDAGGDPADWANRWQQFGTRAAGLRTLENRAAGLTIAENEARALVPRVRELISKVNRTRFPDLNSLLIAARNKTGSEEEIKLGIAIGSLIPVYARVLKPVGQVGQTDMANAQHLLEQKWSAGQLNAALDQFEVELHTAKESLTQARKEYGDSGPALPGRKAEPKTTEPPAAAAAAPKVGERKQFKQGWGVWDGTKYVPEKK